MSKQLVLKKQNRLNVSKLFARTSPNQISEFELHDFDENENVSDFEWIEKSRRLQARRWRKIKHQVA